MKKNNKKGFTLVELLAVIVVLTVILVIVIPKIMSMIDKSKKGSIESAAKLVASKVDLAYKSSLTTDDAFPLSGNDADCMKYIMDYTREYASCKYTLDEKTGKSKVTLIGKNGGKFDGYTCKNATSTSANCTKGAVLTGVNAAELLISKLDADGNGLEKYMFDSDYDLVTEESDAVNIEYRFSGAGETFSYTITDVETCKTGLETEVNRIYNGALNDGDIDSLCETGETRGFPISMLFSAMGIPYCNISSYIGREVLSYGVKNYVTFNDELWRVIGVFKDSDGNYQLKLMKNDYAAYKTSEITSWVNSNAYKYLLNTYYPSLSSDAKDMIDTNSYFNSSSIDLSSNDYVMETYKAENDSSNVINSKIGLINISDFGLAYDREYINNYDYFELHDYQSYNWMANDNEDQWTITKILNGSYLVVGYFRVRDTMRTDVVYNYMLRPVVYLNSSVEIASGTGTIDDPYLLIN